MRIAIVGVGAVGGYFGGRLALTEHEVAFIARGEHLQAIRANGLRVSSENGNFLAHPTQATNDPAAIGQVDVVIVATKAWQLAAAAEMMRPMVGVATTILPLLNGVEAPDMLAQVFGSERVLGGFCRVQSRRDGAGHIVQGGTPPFVAFGELDGSRSTRIAQLQAVFKQAEVTVRVPDSIQGAMWQKLLFVGALGGVGAVTRMPTGIVRTVAESRALLESAMREVYTVAQAREIPMADDAVEQAITLVDLLPENSSMSMQRDILDGYPSELEAQVGAVVRLGAEVYVPTPTNRFIYHSLLPGEMRSRGDLSYAGK